MSDGADLLIVNGRVFQAFGPRDIVPYGSDIGPRPVAGRKRDRRSRTDGSPGSGARTTACATGRGPQTEVVDARGGLITAGFDDAHIHVVGGAQELADVDLFQLESASTPSSGDRRAMRPRTRAPPGSRAAAGCTSRSRAACRPASNWTRSCRTGRRSCAATTATPAG